MTQPTQAMHEIPSSSERDRGARPQGQKSPRESKSNAKTVTPQCKGQNSRRALLAEFSGLLVCLLTHMQRSIRTTPLPKCLVTLLFSAADAVHSAATTFHGERTDIRTVPCQTLLIITGSQPTTWNTANGVSVSWVPKTGKH